MAKRKKKRTSSRKMQPSKPNIPQETLERARQGMADEGAAATTEEDAVSLSAAQELARLRAERLERRASARKSTSEKRKNSGLSADIVADQLANPTRFVTKEELKTQYNYVLQDLRNMGILAAILFMALIGLGLYQTL